MSRIYEEIEVEGKKIKVKIDTASDFPLCLRKEVIEKLGLKDSGKKALLFREENGKMIPEPTPIYLAEIKIKNCPPYVEKITEAFGENLLGHPVLQMYGAKIDEEKEKLIINECPTFFRTGEIRGKIA
ncbi:MAG: hypothetical protein ACTSUF_03440 [Candidatus Heimdallarchaeaceae archaeon]